MPEKWLAILDRNGIREVGSYLLLDGVLVLDGLLAFPLSFLGFRRVQGDVLTPDVGSAEGNKTIRTNTFIISAKC